MKSKEKQGMLRVLHISKEVKVMTNEDKQQKEVQLNVGVDPTRTPILYADAIMITSSENGIVLDITQRVGSSNQASVVSRVGLSKEHAKKLAEKLIEHVNLTQGSAVTGKIKISN